jgi:hypothetical protein
MRLLERELEWMINKTELISVLILGGEFDLVEVESWVVVLHWIPWQCFERSDPFKCELKNHGQV